MKEPYFTRRKQKVNVESIKVCVIMIQLNLVCLPRWKTVKSKQQQKMKITERLERCAKFSLALMMVDEMFVRGENQDCNLNKVSSDELMAIACD